MKFKICVIVILVFGLANLFAESGTVNCDSLYFRLAPSLESTVLGTINYGSIVEINEHYESSPHDWFKITHNGRTGWVSEAYIALSPSPFEPDSVSEQDFDDRQLSRVQPEAMPETTGIDYSYIQPPQEIEESTDEPSNPSITPSFVEEDNDDYFLSDTNSHTTSTPQPDINEPFWKDDDTNDYFLSDTGSHTSSTPQPEINEHEDTEDNWSTPVSTQTTTYEQSETSDTLDDAEYDFVIPDDDNRTRVQTTSDGDDSNPPAEDSPSKPLLVDFDVLIGAFVYPQSTDGFDVSLDLKGLDEFQIGCFFSIETNFYGIPALFEFGFSIDEELRRIHLLAGPVWRFIDNDKFNLSFIPKGGFSNVFVKQITSSYDNDSDASADNYCWLLQGNMRGIIKLSNNYGFGAEIGYTHDIPRGTSTMFDELNLEVNNSGPRCSVFFVFD